LGVGNFLDGAKGGDNMVKVLEIREVISVIIETDKEDFPTYRRYSADNWENLMGTTWEPEYDCDEIEAAYQKYIKKQEEEE